LQKLKTSLEQRKPYEELMGKFMQKIRTIIADDSAFMRVFIKNILRESEVIEIVGTARNGIERREFTAGLHTNHDQGSGTNQFHY
jgi:hypothetical protein